MTFNAGSQEQPTAGMGRKPTTLGIVAANLVPAVGVLFFGWDAFAVVFLYWLENAVIGFFNVFKMALAAGSIQSAGVAAARAIRSDDAEQLMGKVRTPRRRHAGSAGLKLFLIPFFVVHYSGFMFVHGLFIFVLLRGDGGGLGFPHKGPLVVLHREFTPSLLFALACLLVEHGYLFATEFVRDRGYLGTNAAVQMFLPYPRIVVLHVAILFGAFTLVFFSVPRFMVLLLVALKIGLELLTGRIKNALRPAAGRDASRD